MTSLNHAGDGYAGSLLSGGDVDADSGWDFTAADGNRLLGDGGDDWGRYGKCHMGVNADAADETKARWSYPFAKYKGDTITLYRSALTAIRQRAAQQGETEIYDAAGRLIDTIDKKKDSKAMADTTKTTGQPSQLRLQAVAKVNIEAQAVGADPAAPPPLPRFEMVANTGSPMKLAGWKYPVVLDLAGMTIPSQQRPIRYGHDPAQGVGHTDNITIASGMMTAAGIISRDTPASRDIVSSSANGFPWQASVGAEVEEVEHINSGQSVTVNGQQHEGPLDVVTKSTLGEISFVDLGADGNTKARVAAMAKDPNQDPLAGGNGHSTIDGAQAIDQALDRYEKEQQRQRGIEALVVEALGYRGADSAAIKAISKQAMDDGWDVQKTQLNLLIARRPHAPSPRYDSEVPTPKVLEAALCLAAGIPDSVLVKDREYGEAVVTKAYPFRNRGLRGTIAAALQASGVQVPYGNRELYSAVLEHRHSRHVQAEGFSTINLPGILGNVANKILLQAFMDVEATYPIIANQADFSNFHTHSIYRLDMLGDFALVPKDGELKHGNLGQSSYSNKLETSGMMLTLARQDIINDDLNAFSTLTAQLGRKARIAVEKALYAKVMEASDVFYTTGQGNRLTGALGITELAAAEAAMVSQADAGGDPIYANPRYVLVPPGLKSMATSIFLSELLQGATTSTKGQPATNPFRGRFDVVSSPFLAATSLAGSSATTWYLVADPAMLPALQVAYLDGRRAPTIETQDAEFDTLGLQMRCYFDFGVAQIDYRGIVKSTAA